jgi:hypothetical protein
LTARQGCPSCPLVPAAHAVAALVSALTVGSTLLLAACDPQAATGAVAGSTAPAGGAAPAP